MGVDQETEDYLVRLGKRIARARKEKGLSQDGLWYESGLSRRTITKIELGYGDVKISTLIKISKVLDLPLDKLVKF